MNSKNDYIYSSNMQRKFIFCVFMINFPPSLFGSMITGASSGGEVTWPQWPPQATVFICRGTMATDDASVL